MKIINPMSVIPTRPVIIVIFGEPGSRKTSVANTAEKAILLDFDRGYDRSINWGDVLAVEAWQDVQEFVKSDQFTKYDTVIIDTAKAALDDFLATYVISIDSKNKKAAGGLALSGYGAIADEFKISLLEPLRQSGKNLIIVAHSKDDKDNEVTMKIPDVTGQTQSLLIRIADQVGYVGIKNNKPVIEFKPTDRHIGKDTAGIVEVEIPDHTSPEWKGFAQNIISIVKEKIRSKTQQQKEAEQTINQYREMIAEITDVEAADKLQQEIDQLPTYLKIALSAELKAVKDVIVAKAHEPLLKEYREKIGEITNTDDANNLIDPISKLPEEVKAILKPELSTFCKAMGIVFNRQTMQFELSTEHRPDDKPEATLFDNNQKQNDATDSKSEAKSAAKKRTTAGK